MSNDKYTMEDFLKEHGNAKISFRSNRDYTSLEKMIEWSKELEQELAKLKEENENLRKMIDLGLGWEDLKREI